MPDMMTVHRRDDGDEVVVQHLRALPECRPEHDGWARLAAELQSAPRAAQGRSRRRLIRPVAWAMAATLLLALVWPRMASDTGRQSPESVVDVARVPPLDELIAQSQWLENLVSAPALGPDAQDSDQVLLELGLRQRIGAIDVALQSGVGSPQPLWQARVEALTQLAQVRWAGRRGTLAEGVADGGSVRYAVMWAN